MKETLKSIPSHCCFTRGDYRDENHCRNGKGKREKNHAMDDAIFELRKKLWNTIFKEKGDLSDCDVAMALGIVQYELVHHTKEKT